MCYVNSKGQLNNNTNLEGRKMRQAKIERRVEWILANKEEIEKSYVFDHSNCRGNCQNGRTCSTQSSGGWGYWVQAFRRAGVKCFPSNYWSGSAPTPSTSINIGVARYVQANAPRELF